MTNWTDELLSLMIVKFVKRHSKTDEDMPHEEKLHVVPDTVLFNQMGIKVQKG